jgi:hypothetical protein
VDVAFGPAAGPQRVVLSAKREDRPAAEAELKMPSILARPRCGRRADEDEKGNKERTAAGEGEAGSGGLPVGSTRGLHL